MSGEREGAPHSPRCGGDGGGVRGQSGRAGVSFAAVPSRTLGSAAGSRAQEGVGVTVPPAPGSPRSRRCRSRSLSSSSSGAQPCCSSCPFRGPFAPVSQRRGARRSLFPRLAPEILCSSCLAGAERGTRPRGRARGLLCPTVPPQGPQSSVQGAPHLPWTIAQAPAAQVSGATEPLCSPALLLYKMAWFKDKRGNKKNPHVLGRGGAGKTT